MLFRGMKRMMTRVKVNKARVMARLREQKLAMAKWLGSVG